MSIFKGARVLVTGGAGFIGSSIAEQLVQLGATVTIVDDLSAGKLENVADIPGVDFVKLDLRFINHAKRICRMEDFVFHFAANMGGMGYISSNSAVLLDNLTIDLNMLHAGLLRNVKRFLYASSACVYPVYRQKTSNVEPLKESDTLPAQPDTFYGWEKLIAEMLFKTHLKEKVRLPRLHNVYGPGSSFDHRGKAPMHLVTKAIRHPNPPFEIWGDGKQTRSFLYIDDCVEALLKLMESDFSDPINIGSDRLISIDDLAKIIIKISRKDITPIYNSRKPQGVRGRNADITLARKVLDWQPKVSLEEGLQKTYQWAESQFFSKGDQTF